jgi:hypothetical protein
MYTSDFCKRVFFGDLLLHLLCELLFSFCTRTARAAQKLQTCFCTARAVLVQKLNNNSHNKRKSKSPKKTRLQKSAVEHAVLFSNGIHINVRNLLYVYLRQRAEAGGEA